MVNNLTDLLNQDFSTIEKPKLIPAGVYTCVIKGKETGTSQQKQTPYIRYTLTPVNPVEVDEDELAEFGGQAKLLTRTLRLDLYLTEDSLWRVKEFFEKTGIEIPVGSTISSLSEAVLNTTIDVIIAHVPAKSGELIAVIDKVA